MLKGVKGAYDMLNQRDCILFLIEITDKMFKGVKRRNDVLNQRDCIRCLVEKRFGIDFWDKG